MMLHIFTLGQVRWVWGFLLLLQLLLCGCPGPRAEDIDWKALSSTGAFHLGGGDQIHVEVQGREELSRDVVVRPDGMITLPLVGEMSARDRLPDQLAQDIARHLERFIKSPSVNVSVREVHSYAVYVLGEVRSPGEFRGQEPRTLLQALALAGGFTPFASTNSILVLRKRPGKSDMVIPLRYVDILSGKAPEQNIMLASGDTVVVP